VDAVPAGSTGFSTRAYSTAESAFSTVVTTFLVTRRGFGWNSLINTNYIIFKNVEIYLFLNLFFSEFFLEGK
jgi:hypothetical protein